MKISSANRSAGNTLILVMFLTGVMAVSLGSYLLLVRYQNMSIMRSVSWNSCIPLSEAGIEEAMTHINRSGITNLLSAAWTLSDGKYMKGRFLGDNYYIVSISSADPPTIISEGHVPLPLNGVAPLAMLGAFSLTLPANVSYNGRKIQVSTRKDGMWTHAMVAKDTIDLNGNNIATDSFDSTDPNYSTGGQYTSTKRKGNGDVATNSRIVNSLSVGNANINGHASTGPGGSIAIGPNGAIGDINWNNTTTGIQPGSTNNDMNVYFRDVTRPYNSGFAPSSGTLGSTSYTYLLNGADYSISDLSMSGNAVMLVTNQVRLLVTSSIDIKGNAYIEVAKGASLQLYMDGASASIAGNGIVNDNGYAIKFLYFGTTNHTSLSFSGNGTFTGGIYAPNADFSLGGGGSNTQDFIGSSVSKTVKMNGHFHFHYDESLGRSDWARGYLVSSWNEISAP